MVVRELIPSHELDPRQETTVGKITPLNSPRTRQPDSYNHVGYRSLPSLRPRDTTPALNLANITVAESLSTFFSLCGDAVIFSPVTRGCCSQKDTVRPFECQTASRGILDV